MANPDQARDEEGKWTVAVTAAHQAVMLNFTIKEAAQAGIGTFERYIETEHIEHAAVYDQYGRLVLYKKGNHTSVSFTDKELTKLRNNTLTHNHPNDTTFSASDIEMFERQAITKLRVVSDKNWYQLERRPDQQAKLYSPNSYAAEMAFQRYYEIADEADDWVNMNIRNGTFANITFNEMLAAKWAKYAEIRGYVFQKGE